jgi:hypothetical protein
MSRKFFSSDAELAGILFSASGPASLISSTIIPHNIKSRLTGVFFSDIFPIGEVMKTSLEYVYFGISYAQLINRRRLLQERISFIPTSPASNGDHALDPAIGRSQVVIIRKGQFYTRYFIRINANHKWGVKIFHFIDGTPLTPHESTIFFNEFAPAEENLAVRAEHQGIDDPVCPRDVKNSGIIGVRFARATYVRTGFEKNISFCRNEWLDESQEIETSIYK